MSSVIDFRPRGECTLDVISLGEVMLRLDPEADRIRSARSFRVSEGGGEYNVARALSSCFGLRAGIVTAIVDNELGRLIEGFMRQGGLDVSGVQWREFDGVGRGCRNALNFVERGFGVRKPIGVSDRGHSAASMLAPGDIDWDHLFGSLGVRCFHTGGIFTALSEQTARLAEEGIRAAKRYGTRVSYDLNYRPSLWRAHGGLEAARELNARIVPLVDILIGTDPGSLDASESQELSERLTRSIESTSTRHPEIAVIAATERRVHSANLNDWSAVAWTKRTGAIHGSRRLAVQVFDRVGSGDGFAAGLIYGLLAGEDLPRCLEYGIAHGALVMTTPGDTSATSLEEVQALAGSEAQGDIDR